MLARPAGLIAARACEVVRALQRKISVDSPTQTEQVKQLRARFHMIGEARIENLGKYKPCMVLK